MTNLEAVIEAQRRFGPEGGVETSDPPGVYRVGRWVDIGVGRRALEVRGEGASWEEAFTACDRVEGTGWIGSP